jgi:hypothetical protein
MMWAVVVILWVAVLGPSLPGWGRRFVGLEYVDGYGTQWFYHFAPLLLSEGLRGDPATLFFYPWGKDLLGHTGLSVLDALIAWPLRAAFGPTWGYNLFVVCLMATNGLATAAVGARLTGDRLAGAFAGALMSVSPWVLLELTEGRPTQAMLAPAFWVIYESLGPLEDRRAPFRLGLAWALSGLIYWFNAIFLGFALLGVLLARAWGMSLADRRTLLVRGLVGAGVALGLVSPILVMMALRAQDGGVPGLLDVQSWSLLRSSLFTVDGMPVGLFTFQPLRWRSEFLFPSEAGLVSSAQSSPITAIGLCALLVALAKPGLRGLLLALAVPSLILSVGPLLLIGDWALPNPLYNALVMAFPPLRRLWFPERALSLLALAQTLAIGALWARLEAQRVRAGLALGVAVVWGLELYAGNLAPLPSWAARPPAAYQCLAEGPPGAVIDLPERWSAGNVYYQTVHGRPMFGGMLEGNERFTPPELTALRLNNSLWRALEGITRPGPQRRGARDQRAPEVSARDREALGALGYRYVVLRREALPGRADDEVLRRMEAILGPPVFIDARAVIYAPWGSARPCGEIPVERRRVGRSEVTSQERAGPQRPIQLVFD